MNFIKTITFTGLMLSASLFAGNTPVTMTFEEGEQFVLPLSQLNYNRLFVEGERIVKVSYPKGAFIVDQTQEAIDDMDGSVYIKPMTDIELTVFITTNRLHHFSLTVKPNQTLGKTFRFVPKGVEKIARVMQRKAERYQADDAMSDIMNGKIPSGFREVSTQPNPFYLHKTLKLTLMKQYQGESSSAYVYRIENTADKALDLNPSLFANQKLMAVEFSENSLAPHQSAYLYGLYRNA